MTDHEEAARGEVQVQVEWVSVNRANEPSVDEAERQALLGLAERCPNVPVPR